MKTKELDLDSFLQLTTISENELLGLLNKPLVSLNDPTLRCIAKALDYKPDSLFIINSKYQNIKIKNMINNKSSKLNSREIKGNLIETKDFKYAATSYFSFFKLAKHYKGN